VVDPPKGDMTHFQLSVWTCSYLTTGHSNRQLQSISLTPRKTKAALLPPSRPRFTSGDSKHFVKCGLALDMLNLDLKGE
jgi:hypothetical protein